MLNLLCVQMDENEITKKKINREEEHKVIGKKQ